MRLSSKDCRDDNGAVRLQGYKRQRQLTTDTTTNTVSACRYRPSITLGGVLVFLGIYGLWNDLAGFIHTTEATASSPILSQLSRRVGTSFSHGFGTYRRPTRLPFVAIRGGAESSSINDDSIANQQDEPDEDDERYSRQLYTLGARAQGLIRSSTVYLDGPSESGLLYEMAKNLALSGVRTIVLVTNDEDETIDRHYHNPQLDDLGVAYQRAARQEHGVMDDSDISPQKVLHSYVQRLNPSVRVESIPRSQLAVSLRGSSARRHVLVAVDRPYTTQVQLNTMARSYKDTEPNDGNVQFVSVETAGVYGRVFCDFGPSFEVYDADGETPLVTPLDRIEVNAEDMQECMIVHCVEGEKHDVSKGDVIQFQFRDGTKSVFTMVVQEVQTPFRFKVSCDSINQEEAQKHVQQINDEAASFCRVKLPQIVSFEPLDVATGLAKENADVFTPCDLDKSFDGIRRKSLCAAFEALSTFVADNSRLPCIDDFDTFWKLCQNAWDLGESPEDVAEVQRHCKNFARTCGAKLVPFQAIFGAIGAQEALKAATGLYFPTRQFLMYDCDEILNVNGEEDTLRDSQTKLTSGLQHILGDKCVEKLQSQKIFLVGAGAIGCEILKNLAAMGVGTKNGGLVCLTDMDTIEKSNLSRQLLFRDGDIGKFKSVAAHEAALRFNPDIQMESHSSRVGGSDHNPFDERFWSERIDLVLNALDNVDARLFIDSQCVAYEKALVDSGTMGPKGNAQVVVPHQSESYASSTDPPEPAIPVCTLKNFPYAISHTIQWGRDLFDGLFERRPAQANDFAKLLRAGDIESVTATILRDKGEEAAIEVAEELRDDLSVATTASEVELESIHQKSLRWASRLATRLFYTASKDLLKEHPLDSVDEDGEPFWAGTRRPPQALEFVPGTQEDSDQGRINANLVEFVRSAARLRSETFAIHGHKFSVEEVQNFLASDNTANTCATGDGQPVQDRIKSLLAGASSNSIPLVNAQFEKDDESNDHVAFVTAASNLRAIAYGIPPVDAMETRRIAGNIVPAMITTTAFVSALSCIELIKLVQHAPLSLHRNAFINLALPFFAFTVPLPAEERPGLQGQSYTLWDRLVIKESKKSAAAGGIKLRSLLRRLRNLASDEPDDVVVTSISCGPYMLYANFLHEDDEDLLKTSVWDLIDEAVVSGDDDEGFGDRDGEASEPVTMDCESHVDLSVVVEDVETGEEVELPPVRLNRYRP